MKELNLTLVSENKPLYLRIAEAIRQSIRQGMILPGEKIPSTREWSKVLQVHRHTVMNALNELVAEGWIVAKERHSYQVCDSLPMPYLESGPEQQDITTPHQQHQWNVVREPLHVEKSDLTNYQYYFRGGAADLRMFPFNELKSHLTDSLKKPAPSLLDYGNTQGHLPLIESLKVYLRRMRAITERSIIVTHGSQEAIYLCGQVLLQPGDVVAVEKLGYPPAWNAFRSAGAKLVAIDQDEQGVDPDALLKLVKKNSIKLIYLTPLHQYPTTLTLPVSRRMRLYEIAANYDIPILEDDYDHEFHFRCQPMAPLASNDPRGLVIYVSTFSKVLFPSARIGFMAVPQKLADAIIPYRKIVSYQQETLIQDAVARWMESGGLERHLRRMCNAYEKRRNVMVGCLKEAMETGIPLDFRIPDGGMALWLNTFQDSKVMAEKAKKVGVLVHSEESFHLNGDKGTHLRIGFAHHTPDEIKSGMTLLLNCLKT